jgi:ribosomal protein S12 methylthiotransferase accessory factor YcaO
VSHSSRKREVFIALEDIPNQSTYDRSKDIELYLDRLSINDTDVVITNLSHSKIGIPVVRVVIPKLISYSESPIKELLFLDTMKAFSRQF